jgi:hypothetical protein
MNGLREREFAELAWANFEHQHKPPRGERPDGARKQAHPFRAVVAAFLPAAFFQSPKAVAGERTGEPTPRSPNFVPFWRLRGYHSSLTDAL